MGSITANLRQELENRVLSRTHRRVRNLSVEVSPECVVLQGQAVSYHVKQLAQQGVQEFMPHVRLENAIIVG
jgi:hypothetical protein